MALDLVFETYQRPVVDEYGAVQHDSPVSNGARLDFPVRLPFKRVELNAQEALLAVQDFSVLVSRRRYLLEVVLLKAEFGVAFVIRPMLVG